MKHSGVSTASSSKQWQAAAAALSEQAAAHRKQLQDLLCHLFGAGNSWQSLCLDASRHAYVLAFLHQMGSGSRCPC